MQLNNDVVVGRGVQTAALMTRTIKRICRLCLYYQLSACVLSFDKTLNFSIKKIPFLILS